MQWLRTQAGLSSVLTDMQLCMRVHMCMCVCVMGLGIEHRTVYMQACALPLAHNESPHRSLDGLQRPHQYSSGYGDY